MVCNTNVLCTYKLAYILNIATNWHRPQESNGLRKSATYICVCIRSNTKKTVSEKKSAFAGQYFTNWVKTVKPSFKNLQLFSSFEGLQYWMIRLFFWERIFFSWSGDFPPRHCPIEQQQQFWIAQCKKEVLTEKLSHFYPEKSWSSCLFFCLCRVPGLKGNSSFFPGVASVIVI